MFSYEWFSHRNSSGNATSTTTKTFLGADDTTNIRGSCSTTGITQYSYQQHFHTNTTRFRSALNSLAIFKILITVRNLLSRCTSLYPSPKTISALKPTPSKIGRCWILLCKDFQFNKLGPHSATTKQQQRYRQRPRYSYRAHDTEPQTRFATPTLHHTLPHLTTLHQIPLATHACSSVVLLHRL